MNNKVKYILIFLIIIVIIIGIIFIVPNNKKIDKIKKTTTFTTTKVINNKEKEVNFTLVGDFLFESPFYNAIDNKNYDKNRYFSLVKNYFINDDITIGNMEVPIGNKDLPVSGDGYNFCAPTYVGDLVSGLDFQVLSTANNHTYDKGLKGVMSTLDYFDNTNIKIVGSYRNQEDRNNNRIINVNDVKVGFLAYTLGTNIAVPDNERNLIGLYRNKDKTINYELLKNEINNIRPKVDILVVMMHWGNEFTFTPNNEQKELAKFLNEQGVDIIYGSHSHSIQPIEIIGDEKKTLVYYSLGNFVSHDDDIARTEKGYETFDNAYQFGLLSKVKVKLIDNKINFEDINTEIIVNYFNKDMSDFLLVPLKDYDKYEKDHLRYNLGLNKEFINSTYNNVISEEYRK